ncbi:hypothetical protein [Sediminibacillus albus]|uniref:Uncharacterized protein n=1 Tax=Sediminibacillus albus TaxID=407036 RepID=A0A1G8WMD4_9BACI|nr:hypothetical protein [Sediminibacillus albus]SDJ78815.1 hypothetical protein SAMN05216243_0859 [Sediminibacillus albus]
MIRRIFNLNTLYILMAIIAIGILLIPRIIESINLQSKGISYITSNIEDYYHNAFPKEGKYTVEIDLIDIESNEGKVLFEDSENTIDVTKVTHSGSKYEVIFRSRGSFGSGGAILISGLEHTHKNNSFTSHFKAKAEAVYKDETYELSPSGSSGLDYRDGEHFGFYLFPPNQLKDIDLEEDPILEVTITNLQVNLWVKKPNK